MRREPPLRIFLSHTPELREHPRERSYVAAAETAVMRAVTPIRELDQT